MEDCRIEGNGICVRGEIHNILRTCMDGNFTGSIAAIHRVMDHNGVPECEFQIVHDVVSDLIRDRHQFANGFLARPEFLPVTHPGRFS